METPLDTTPSNTNIIMTGLTPNREFKTPSSLAPESPVVSGYPRIPTIPPPQSQQVPNDTTTSAEDQVDTNMVCCC